MILELMISIVVCYLIGSVSGSIVLGKIKGIDIRSHGSGNAGATNAFRTLGFFFAFGVMLIDVLKSYLPILILQSLDIFDINTHSVELLLCGLAAVLGHVYPIYHQFKGGKGAGTLVGVILALFPGIFLFILLIWILVLILSGYVGLSTMIAGISFTIMTYFYCVANYGTFNHPFGYFSIAISLFLIFTHRSNIMRMLQGTENQFEKVMIFKKIKNS